MTINACNGSGIRVVSKLRSDGNAHCPTCGRLQYVGAALTAAATPQQAASYRIPRHRA